MNNDPLSGYQDQIQELEKQLSELREKTYFQEKEIQVLREEKEKYQLISDFAQDWQFWIDPSGNFTWISPSCNDITGSNFIFFSHLS